ncbi:MAG: right-handed parallel beta-helix repeat-containing protein [Candidatus Thorarchaeota archaeon]|nr:right-handed parallel beta-helix repeat-containing protein [Candidatus Thorarchaeota archaeon]
MFSSLNLNFTHHQSIGPITLTNVSNGRVERNQIVDSFVAVSGYLLSNCSISDNILSVSFSGISVACSNFTLISNNTQGYEPCIYGMSVDYCRNITISLNEFKNITAFGMYAGWNYDLHIIENSFLASTSESSHTWVGIQVQGEELCSIQRNVVSDFGYTGMDVRGSNYTVQDNNITSCDIGFRISTNNSTFTGNRINGSNIALDMVQANDTKVHGNSVVGRNGHYDTGIAMHGGHDCDIYSNIISRIGSGLFLQGASRFNVSDNSVTDGRYGFVFGWYANWGLPNGPFFDCDIINNTLDNGGIYLTMENYEGWDFDTIRFVGNTVHGEPIGLFTNLDQETIDGDSFGQLLLVSCNEITISGGYFYDVSSLVRYYDYDDHGQASAITLVNCTACDLANNNFHSNTIGITLRDSSHCSITGGFGYYNSWSTISLSYCADIDVENVDIRDSLTGIDLRWSYNCYISNCLVRDNTEGIALQYGLNCTLSHNTIFQNSDGIYLDDSDGSEIRSNTVYGNDRGVLLNSTSECLITQNNVYDNIGVGISLDSTSNRNEIFNNTLSFNTPNAICEGTSNHWDNQIDTGNWWSDYNGEGPYIIDENDQDNFPITNEPTISNETTTTNGSWSIDPFLVGIVGGVVGIIGLVIIIAYRRRVAVAN